MQLSLFSRASVTPNRPRGARVTHVTAVSHIAGSPRDIANGVEHTVLSDPSKLNGVYTPDFSNGQGNVEACQASPEDIDLLLYCGCDKGCFEPSQAHYVTNALRIPNANAFDVTEACAGFVRALEIAELYITTGQAQNVAIVSAISPPDDLLIKAVSETNHNFSSLTVSSCATATIVGRAGHKSQGMGLEVVRKTDSLGVTMCSLPTKHFRDFLADNTGTDEWTSSNGKLNARHARSQLQDGEFTVFSGPLFQTGRALSAQCLESMTPEQKDGKVFITHSAAKETAYAGLGIPLHANHLNLYSTMGNCADSTLPLSIANGILQGRIAANDKVSFLIPASGNTCVAGCLNLPTGTKACDSVSLKEGDVQLSSVCLTDQSLDSVSVLSSLASLEL
ncbi:hypothetical protein WJX74_010278 [Apatococcus lobatus]|uniref:Beta-ketoacyl-[acyl-carrier-protein] synthase III N-terminal domain-containing protein n=1 Tax=Apatococcus lobatus TaxID=904363 RepID=A0AAW1QJ09_9CHLO